MIDSKQEVSCGGGSRFVAHVLSAMSRTTRAMMKAVKPRPAVGEHCIDFVIFHRLDDVTGLIWVSISYRQGFKNSC